MSVIFLFFATASAYGVNFAFQSGTTHRVSCFRMFFLPILEALLRSVVLNKYPAYKEKKQRENVNGRKDINLHTNSELLPVPSRNRNLLNTRWDIFACVPGSRDT